MSSHAIRVVIFIHPSVLLGVITAEAWHSLPLEDHSILFSLCCMLVVGTVLAGHSPMFVWPRVSGACPLYTYVLCPPDVHQGDNAGVHVPCVRDIQATLLYVFVCAG